jgi:hypothetical protein
MSPGLPPPVSDDDRRLFDSAAALDPGAPCPTSNGGIDLATAALYLQTASRHRAFIHRVDSPKPPPRQHDSPHVLIMPGAFHAEYPHTGADGARVRELAAQLRWTAERIPVPSLGSLSANARLLTNHLSRSPGRPTIVVSLSKGGADVRTALALPSAASDFRDVLAWVNISGLATGTPLVAWLRSRPLRCLGARLLLRLRGQRFAELDELRHGTASPLARPWAALPHVRIIHVLGFPLERHLSDNWARRGHARLAPLGPNDGGGILLHDALSWPGDLYPVWGADHYLRPPWDIRPLLLRILQEAATPTTAAAGSPAMASAAHR